MVTLLYTTSDAVRAALGIETEGRKKELPDEMFSNQDMERQLRAALYAWLPSHADIISEADEVGATDEQVHKGDLVRNYCLYWCARRAAEMAYATRRRVGDGKSEVERFQVDWLALAERMGELMAEQKQLLEELLSPSDTLAFAARAVPTYDPVTNT